MARMYPSQLPKHVRENPKLSSEIRVYEKLRDQLADDYHVYYSRSCMKRMPVAANLTVKPTLS